MSAQATGTMRLVSARVPLGTRLLNLWRFRELLVGMVRTQLKVKYKNSVLGFVWSMLNPLLYLVVFYIVFVIVFRNQQPLFPIFLLSGLLAWNLFSTGLAGATGAIVGNAGIVKKVSFPREILPLSAVGAGLVHFFLQSLVLFASLLVFRYHVDFTFIPMIIPALVVLLVFTSALGVFLSALNVYLRDTEHFLELLLLAWFWFTPIVWPFQAIATAHEKIAWVALLNPVTDIVLVFQRAIYNKISYRNGTTHQIVKLLPNRSMMWYGSHLALVGLLSVVLFVGAVAFFGRVEGNFAEEL